MYIDFLRNIQILSAIVELLTFGGFGIWYFIDIILILTGNFKDADGNRLVEKKQNIIYFVVFYYLHLSRIKFIY